jgi:hypothetical protein
VLILSYSRLVTFLVYAGDKPLGGPQISRYRQLSHLMWYARSL